MDYVLCVILLIIVIASKKLLLCLTFVYYAFSCKLLLIDNGLHVKYLTR